MVKGYVFSNRQLPMLPLADYVANMSPTCRRHVADTGKCWKICPKLHVCSDMTHEKRVPDTADLCVVPATPYKITTSCLRRRGRRVSALLLPRRLPLLLRRLPLLLQRLPLLLQRLPLLPRRLLLNPTLGPMGPQTSEQLCFRGCLHFNRHFKDPLLLLILRQLLGFLRQSEHLILTKANLLGRVVTMLVLPADAAILLCH
jgi:hypothetical protein